MTARSVLPTPSRDELQGWIVGGYNMAHSRQIVTTIHDPVVVREHLDAATAVAENVTQIQLGSRWTTKPEYTINVGVTATGLAALGVSAKVIAAFPSDFREGPAVRAGRLGDTGESAPSEWDSGMDDPNRVHLLWTIHGQTAHAVDQAWAELASAHGSAISVVAQWDGEQLPDSLVHFGYVDSISQPVVSGFGSVPEGCLHPTPEFPLGAFFLGHESQFEGVTFDVPEPAELTVNGTYNAFRVLEQDVFGFERFLAQAAEETGRDAEWLAAKVCGRWRNGNPLSLTPNEAGEPMDRVRQNDFEFDDNDGSVCPIGSHIRRSNPRNAPIVQKNANHTKPVIRRGMPYGPLMEPGQQPDGIPRGLLGNFFCASLATQFEGLQNGWINHGLIHPNITGTNDPMVGVQDPMTSRFTIPMSGGDNIELRGFDRFVRTRASAYTFMPSIAGLRTLALG